MDRVPLTMASWDEITSKNTPYTGEGQPKPKRTRHSVASTKRLSAQVIQTIPEIFLAEPALLGLGLRNAPFLALRSNIRGNDVFDMVLLGNSLVEQVYIDTDARKPIDNELSEPA